MAHDHLENAKALIASGSDVDLLYACLELRMEIEKHVYEKLKFYSKRHGAKLLYKAWQPNKALKNLTQLEPNADKSYVLRMADEDRDGEPASEFQYIGRHEALTASWVTKNYNKLGSCLHLPPNLDDSLPVDREYLDEVVSELERVGKGTLICDIAETVSFTCAVCEEMIVCCTHALSDLDEVTCHNPECAATYSSKKDSENWSFKLNAVDFDCPECGAQKPVLVDELAVGVGIVCKGCDTIYKVIRNEWKIGKANS